MRSAEELCRMISFLLTVLFVTLEIKVGVAYGTSHLIIWDRFWIQQHFNKYVIICLLLLITPYIQLHTKCSCFGSTTVQVLGKQLRGYARQV